MFLGKTITYLEKHCADNSFALCGQDFLEKKI